MPKRLESQQFTPSESIGLGSGGNGLPEEEQITAFEQGKQDALQGKVSQEMIFSGTAAHNDYILGFRAGIKERQAYAPKIRKPAQPTLFSMREVRQDDIT